MPLYKRVLSDIRKQMDSVIRVDRSDLPYAVKLQTVIELMAKELKIDKMSKPSEEKTQKASMAVCLHGIVADLNGNLPHYYIPDDSLEEWLSSIPVKDFNGIADVDIGYEMYAVHTHNHGYFISKLTRIDHTVILVVHDSSGETILTGDEGFLQQCDEAGKNMIQFSINFLYYIRCFPEMLTDGAPNDVPHKALNELKRIKGKQLTLGTAEKIKHRETHGNYTTYYRRGYFRHYPENSTWYKNMKGKTTWINATVCNGKGRTKTVNSI